MKRLHHNGVLVPPKYEGKGFTIKIRGKKHALTSEQEEMTVAWVKKVGTPYVEDSVFSQNFHREFSAKLGTTVTPDIVDYSEILLAVEKEKALKVSLSREERKKQAAARKERREANRERFGYATVDKVQIEVANYAVEPNCIFMGRGKHPLRGRWKEGPDYTDIELNLSPDAQTPRGNWKGVVWQPDSMWIAKWDDKLRGREKYIWLSDSSTPKQEREIEKFDKAAELASMMNKIRAHIKSNLESDDPKRRKIANLCRFQIRHYSNILL